VQCDLSFAKNAEEIRARLIERASLSILALRETDELDFRICLSLCLLTSLSRFRRMTRESISKLSKNTKRTNVLGIN